MAKDSENIAQRPTPSKGSTGDTKRTDAKVKKVTDVGTHCPTCGKRM